MDLEVALDSFDPDDLRRARGWPAGLSSLPGFHRGDRQRFVPNRRHGDRPVQHEHAGGDRRWDHHQSDHARGRRASQGTAQADPGSSRDAAESDSPRKHADGHPGRGGRSAGHAGLVSPPSAPRRPDQLRRRPDLRSARHRQQLDRALGRRSRAGCAGRKSSWISRSRSTSHDPEPIEGA